MTPASATTGITMGAPRLPGELLDAILDSITFDDDEKALDTLRACMLVSRAFRLRAMYILIAHLDFSAAYGRAHILKSLELFDLLRASPDLCALPRSVVLDLGEPGVLAAPALDILPALPNLKELTLSELDACDAPLPRWKRPLEVEHLILESCSMDTEQLDGLLESFPKLRKLQLVHTHVSPPEDGDDKSRDVAAPVSLPFSACTLELSLPDPASSMAVFNWAIAHRESFIELSTLTLAPSAVPGALRDEFFAVFGGDVTTLTLGLAEAQLAADDEKATLDACKSVCTLNILTPSLPRALVLFRSVRLAPPPRVKRVFISTSDKADPRAEDIKALRDALGGWIALDQITIDNTPIAIVDTKATTQPATQVDDVKAADVYAPRVVVEAEDSAFDVLLVGPAVDDDDDCECDDETVGAPTPSLHIPAQYRDEDESDSNTDEPSPRWNSYAPPFALGVSAAHYDDTDESELESDSDFSDLDTPYDSNVELPEIIDLKRDPYAPPFSLGVGIVHPHDEGEDEDGGVDVQVADPYKPPFALSTSTSLGMENEELVD